MEACPEKFEEIFSYDDQSLGPNGEDHNLTDSDSDDDNQNHKGGAD